MICAIAGAWLTFNVIFVVCRARKTGMIGSAALLLSACSPSGGTIYSNPPIPLTKPTPVPTPAPPPTVAPTFVPTTISGFITPVSSSNGDTTYVFEPAQ